MKRKLITIMKNENPIVLYQHQMMHAIFIVNQVLLISKTNIHLVNIDGQLENLI